MTFIIVAYILIFKTSLSIDSLVSTSKFAIKYDELMMIGVIVMISTKSELLRVYYI